jgi:hypothetical protein
MEKLLAQAQTETAQLERECAQLQQAIQTQQQQLAERQAALLRLAGFIVGVQKCIAVQSEAVQLPLEEAQ